jgi:DNA polymerase-3 subunit alpha
VLAWEKDVLGFYASGHPMARYRKIIEFASSHKIDSLPADSNTKVQIAGMIANVIRRTSKRNEQYAKFKLENFDGELEVWLFPGNFAPLNKYLTLNSMVVIRGRMNIRDNEQAELVAEDIIPLDEYEKKHIKTAKEIYIKFSSWGIDEIFITKLKHIISAHAGDTKVYFKIHSSVHPEGVTIETPNRMLVTEKTLGDLEKLLGENSYDIV